MPDQFTWNQFNAGWIPSDDQFNGRKNGCLVMDNVELDKNGSLTLQGGTVVVGSAYTYESSCIFSASISGTRYDYVVDTNSGIFRNGSSIGTGTGGFGAFATAYDYVLIACNDTRLKDTGTGTPQNLGIDHTDWAGTAELIGLLYTGSGATVVDFSANGTITQVQGTSALIGYSVPYAELSIAVDTVQFLGIIQNDTISGGPLDLTQMQAYAIGTGAISGVTAEEDPSDTIQVNIVFQGGMVPDIGNVSMITGVTLDIFVANPGTSGAMPSDFFTATQNLTPAAGQYLSLTFKRSDFTRIGVSSADWSTVYGFRLSVQANQAIQFHVYMQTGMQGASGNGSYEYLQVNVNQTTSYTAMSDAQGTPSPTVSVTNQITKILPDLTVAGADPQVNQIWIYKRSNGGTDAGGGLATWYRVLVFLDSTWHVPQYDIATDETIETIGLTLNLNLVSINSTGISDAILAIIGPMEGRWFYVAGQIMYPSDINDPDLVDTSLGIRVAGSTSELFLWARKVSNNAILIGTSLDVYLLTGTFVTLPDGTIDVYYQSLGCKHPPISYDATYANGLVYYIANDGWRSIDASGNCVLLVAPSLDRLFRGITCYGYSVDSQILPGQANFFPCTFASNKLWALNGIGADSNSRMYVLDTVRNYWRPVNFGTTPATIKAMCTTPDGYVLAFFDGDKKLRQLDMQSSLEIDGSTKQLVKIQSPVFDGGTPKQRHELYTLKVRFQGGTSEDLTVTITLDNGTTYTATSSATAAGKITEVAIDLSSVFANSGNVLLPRFWWYNLSGSFSVFTLVDITIDFDTRPQQITALHLLPNNHGNASKKRVRVQPFIIDPIGNNVVVTPIVDGSAQSTTTFTGSRKQTFLLFYTTDVFGIDYEYELNGNGLFEFFEAMQPDIVQTLPIARQFDQVGPEELFRYGRIRQFELRVLPFGTSIPIAFYFSDNLVITSDIACQEGLEQSVIFGLPMGAGGQIVRITLGPTDFNFHRFYLRVQVMKSGSDTANEWILLPDPNAGA